MLLYFCHNFKSNDKHMVDRRTMLASPTVESCIVTFLIIVYPLANIAKNIIKNYMLDLEALWQGRSTSREPWAIYKERQHIL